MYTPYLLILTMFSGAGEIVDPEPHASLASCESELVRMRAAAENEWAEHGILRMSGECRAYDADAPVPAVGFKYMPDSDPEPAAN